jgi:hypothetical protein
MSKFLEGCSDDIDCTTPRIATNVDLVTNDEFNLSKAQDYDRFMNMPSSIIEFTTQNYTIFNKNKFLDNSNFFIRDKNNMLQGFMAKIYHAKFLCYSYIGNIKK